jgi:hypothetical protein
VAKGMYQTLLYFIETFVTLDIQLTTMFYLVATLCQGGGNMMDDGYVKRPFGINSILPHIPKVNPIEVSKVHFES